MAKFNQDQTGMLQTAGLTTDEIKSLETAGIDPACFLKCAVAFAACIAAGGSVMECAKAQAGCIAACVLG